MGSPLGAKLYGPLPSIPNESDRVLPSPFCNTYWSSDRSECLHKTKKYHTTCQGDEDRKDYDDILRETALVKNHHFQKCETTEVCPSGTITDLENVDDIALLSDDLVFHESSEKCSTASNQYELFGCADSTYHLNRLPHQFTMLFDVVQEQTEIDATRAYNSDSVHSTHSESDTLYYPPFSRIAQTKKKINSPLQPTSLSSNSISDIRVNLSVHTSPVTNNRSKSQQPESNSRSLHGSDGASRKRTSPLRLGSSHSDTYPHTHVTEILHLQNGSLKAWEQESKSTESKPHRIRIRSSSGGGQTDGGRIASRSAHAVVRAAGKSKPRRGQTAVNQLSSTGSGQKAHVSPNRSPSTSRWTTESHWSPIEVAGLGCQRGIRTLRTKTFREVFADPIEERRPSRHRGVESGRLSHAFAFKSADVARGRINRGTHLTCYTNPVRIASSGNGSGYTGRRNIYYCVNCHTDRVHRSNQCSYCGYIGCFDYCSSDTGGGDLLRMTEHPDLLRTAARGLSELSQHSSDDDDLSYQYSLPSTLTTPLYSPYESQPDQTSSDSRSTSSHHTYTMESNGDGVQRPREIGKQQASNSQMDSACSLSNSGSFTSDPEKPNGAGTYHRPKLPTTLMQNQSPRLGKRFPDSSEFSTQMHLPDSTPIRNGKMDNTILSETQKLVAQLEERMITNGSSTVKASSLDARLTSEDQEVAEAFTNPNGNRGQGINRRLLAMLQRRNPHLKSPGLDSERRSSSDNGQTENAPRRQSNPARRTAGTVNTSRPKSQQPVCRTTLYDADLSECDQDSLTKRNGSKSRVTGQFYPEVTSQPNSYRSTLIHTPVHVRDGWEGVRAQSLIKSSSVTSPRLQGSANDSAKLSALLNWQRRKAYDPRTAIASTGIRVVDRSSTQSLRDDEAVSASTDDGPKTKRQQQQSSSSTNSGTKLFYRNKSINRRTAPVETVDCVEALDSIRLTTNNSKPFPAHCSVVSNLLNPTRVENGGVSVPRHSDRLIYGPSTQPTNRLSRSSGEEVNRKKRVPRAISLSSSTAVENNHSQSIGVNPKRESRGLTKTNSRKGNQAGTISSRTPAQANNRVTTIRCASQVAARTSPSGQTGRDMGVATMDCDVTSTHNRPIPNELVRLTPNYPDMGVESIRYKIERLTNFIVRMRKRIERDYAEQGTCSPGDDVFGDEAVGATVAGRSTGMHPVVVSSLKNLRILEFNAQEIFSLLYPTEVDMWEPARACLAADVGDDQTFNEARSKLTEHLSNSIQANEGGMACRRSTPTQSPEQSGVQTPTHVPDKLADDPAVATPGGAALQETMFQAQLAS